MIAGKSWDIKKLRNLADIRVSNVDKKIHSSERTVKLCNYMDVYANEYITGSIQFMEGSANDAEIERFRLNIGDVIITKDSETPDDIGIPAVIHEQIDNLVCGYHLALIRPDNEKLDSIFLSKYLSTSRVANYFALHASGSTRFGLPIGAIESVEILTPPKKEQEQIAEVLSTIDRAIAQTEAIIAKQQRLKTGLMQDLLTKGIDEHGNIRNEATHEFKDSAIGRIPVEWEVESLDNCVMANAPICYGILMPGFYYNAGVPVIKVKDIIGGSIIQDDLLLTDPKIDRQYQRSRLLERDLLITIRGTTGRVALVPSELRGANITQDTARVRLQDDYSKDFFYFLLQSFHVQDQVLLHTLGQAVKGINIAELKKIQISLPPLDEQEMIAQKLNQITIYLRFVQEDLIKLKQQKTGLMQDLLTGKVRVTNLLKEKEPTSP